MFPNRSPALLAVLILGVTTAASYFFTRDLRNGPFSFNLAAGSPSNVDTTNAPIPFETGDYLIAFIMTTSECGFCTERMTKDAIGRMRDSLRVSNSDAFADVVVVAVVMDSEVQSGIRYLESIGRISETFDAVVVGNSWLNEKVINLVWRDGVALPLVPQVVVVTRSVDASAYPRHIDVGADTLVLKVQGRDELIDWVNRGARISREDLGR